MAYTPHTLITWHGVLGDTSTSPQTWSIGLRVPIDQLEWAGIIALDPTALDTFAVLCKDAFTSAFLPETLTNSVFFFGTKVAILNAAGHYVAPPTETIYDLTTAYGTGAAWKPFQIALVATLKHTGIGRGNFGRFYMPCPNTTPARNGHITAVQAGVWADAFNNFVEGVNIAVTGWSADSPVSIFSRSTGSVKVVDTVGCGSVMDTQRRRRDQLVEAIEYRAV